MDSRMGKRAESLNDNPDDAKAIARSKTPEQSPAISSREGWIAAGQRFDVLPSGKCCKDPEDGPAGDLSMTNSRQLSIFGPPAP